MPAFVSNKQALGNPKRPKKVAQWELSLHLVCQARRRGASIGEATAQALTILWKLDRLTAMREQVSTENA